MQVVPFDLALAQLLHQLHGGDDGAHALLRDDHHGIGCLDDLGHELGIGEAAKIHHLEVEEGAQAVQQGQGFRVRDIAQLGQRARQRQHGHPVGVARQRGAYEHLVEAAQVAHGLGEMNFGRDIEVQRAVARRQAEVEQQHLAGAALAHRRREVHGGAGHAHALARAQHRHDLAVAGRLHGAHIGTQRGARHHQPLHRGLGLRGGAVQVDEVPHAGAQRGQHGVRLGGMAHGHQRHLREQAGHLFGQARRGHRVRRREIEKHQSGPERADLVGNGLLRAGLHHQRAKARQRAGQPVAHIIARGVEQEDLGLGVHGLTSRSRAAWGRRIRRA
ncbi:hypothetical protein D3C87_1210430 [compost metagenome]